MRIVFWFGLQYFERPAFVGETAGHSEKSRGEFLFVRDSSNITKSDFELKKDVQPNSEGIEDASFTRQDLLERRRRPRIYEPFPATVRGEDVDGESFDIETVLENIGPKGLYVRLARNIKLGAHMRIVVRLTSCQDRSVFAPSVAILGEVLRAEAQSDGRYGVAVRFRHHRFL